MSAWMTCWRDWARRRPWWFWSVRNPSTRTTNQELNAYQKILNQNEELRLVDVFARVVLLRVLPLLIISSLDPFIFCTNGLRVSRARASPRCHGRPPPNGCSSVCLSLWGLSRVYVPSTAAILIYNFRDAQNNTVDNIWQLSACEFPLPEWLMQNSCLRTTSYQLRHAESIIYGWVNELWVEKKKKKKASYWWSKRSHRGHPLCDTE